jgi:peptidoglycan/LPS O-acetylase OafA/YrhL
MTNSSSSTLIIEPLISLRFIFAAMIFLHHCNLFYSGGALGVTFFFILSGFVITLGYEGKILSQKITPFDFLVKRFIRLYPLHILCFGAAIVLSLNSLCLKSVLIAIPNLLLLQSWIPIREIYFSFNSVSWCLSNQMFFYALFPLIVIFFHKTGKRQAFVLFMTMVIAYFSLTLMNIPQKLVHPLFYIFPLSRLLDFVLGIFLYYLYRWLKNKEIEYCFSKLQVNLIELLAISLVSVAIVFAGYVKDVYRYGLYFWIPISVLILYFAYFNRGGG